MTLLEATPTLGYEGGSIPVLETERLVLRAPTLGDVKAIAMFAGDIRVAQNTARIPHPYTEADAEAFIAQTNGASGDVTFAITLADHVLIGMCGFATLRGTRPELGYWLGAPHWGRGYATEAARAVLDYAFGSRELDELEAGSRVSNPASRRVLEKCGFQWTGVGLYRIRAINSSAPVDRFRLDRRLWQALKNWGTVRQVA